MNDEDNAMQMLAQMCESGILEKPRISDNGNKISYRLKEEYRQHLLHLAEHPEILGTHMQQFKPLLEKLLPVLGEE